MDSLQRSGMDIRKISNMKNISYEVGKATKLQFSSCVSLWKIALSTALKGSHDSFHTYQGFSLLQKKHDCRLYGIFVG